MTGFSQTNDAMERARAIIDGMKGTDLDTWKALDALMGVFEAMMWEAARIPVILADPKDLKKSAASSTPKAAPNKVSDDDINRAYL